jgi:aryl-alcohol dehydrogenase
MMVTGRGLTVRGIVEGDSDPDIFIPELIKLYRAGLFPFDKLIKTYAFEAINQAIADQHDGKVIKPVLLMPI